MVRGAIAVAAVLLAALLGAGIPVCSQAVAAVGGENRPDVAERLLAEANQARSEAGVGRLHWDEALAQAALDHCRLMAAQAEISHQFPGEPSVNERAGAAGAHFSLIEENVAVSFRVESLHPGWMNSPEHRRNLLNPAVDRVGIAVVRQNDFYYAVADYSRGVAAMSDEQVEAKVSALVSAAGVEVMADRRDARVVCELNSGLPAKILNGQPVFVMRFQDAELDRLPPVLEERLRSRQFRRAAVGACPAKGRTESFTIYRLAVLLYNATPPPRTPGMVQPYN